MGISAGWISAWRVRTLTGAAALALTGALGRMAGPARGEEEVTCGCLAHRLEQVAEGHFGAHAAHAAGVFDPATGEDHRNFPPDPLVEYRSMRLRLRLEDLEQRMFTAVQELTVHPIGVPVQGLTLNAPGLEIHGVRVDGKEAEWTHDGERLAIRFGQPLPARETIIETTYTCRQPVRGMTFSPATPEIPGVARARRAELYTQGQPESNRYWFPIHDSPNVRLATELIADVPADTMVSGNGTLVEHTARDGREVWHWRQEKPHVPYLVSLVAGEFERVELPNPRSGVPMAVWLQPGRAEDARQTYRNTDAMIALFEDRFGVKYPWARYDQLLVRNFGAGGMENTSATNMHPDAVHDAVARREQDLDGLISHELCHQWTGDLITCRSWEHLWLNEGWATYGTALWFEERDGPDGYYTQMLNSASVAQRDSTDDPEGMCSPVYANPGETFRRSANPYSKGASILHMLRRMLGDEVFFKGVRTYMNRHAGGLVETSDFRDAMEEASGLGLEWFFDQWCFRPGSPRVKIRAAYDTAARLLTVSAEQTQTINARTPAMRLRMPVWVKTAAGEQVVPFEMRGKSAQVQVELDGPPQAVWVDPWLDALKTIEVEQPEAWTLAALREGPTLAARRQALDALQRTETLAAREALAEVARASGAPHTLRNAAIEGLQGYRSPESQALLLAIFDEARQGDQDPRVLARLTEALGTCPAGEAVSRLRALLAPVEEGGTPSYAVRVAAINALVELDAKDTLPLMRRNAEFPSHAQSVSQAALRALARWGTAEDVPLVKSRAALGLPDRARPQALDALARMAERLDEPSRREVEVFVIAMLNDPESRTAGAAGDALARMKCTAALPRLKAIAGHDRDPQRRERAQRWVRQIEGTEGNEAPAAGSRRPRRT